MACSLVDGLAAGIEAPRGAHADPASGATNDGRSGDVCHLRFLRIDASMICTSPSTNSYHEFARLVPPPPAPGLGARGLDAAAPTLADMAA
jgi:hypothetical protein